MTINEILAKLLVLEMEAVKLQMRIHDLYEQIREGLDDSTSV